MTRNALGRLIGYGLCLVLLFALLCQIAALVAMLGYVTLYIVYGVIGIVTHWNALWHCGNFCPR